MITIPFDVNNNKLRESFFNQLFADCISCLSEDAVPLQGKMTPQEMIEHLTSVFQCSTGKLEVACHTPENIIERAKKFLYNDNPTPHDFKNPLIGKDPQPLHYKSFAEAVDSLRKELIYFQQYFRAQPNAIHVHPLFGPLNAEEWQRSHFKHSYHHLLQFGLINQVD